MAVVDRFYGINYGELGKTGAGQQPITEGVTTTNKHIEVVIDMGDAAGNAAQQAAFVAHKDRANVVCHLRALADYIETAKWPPART